MIKRHALKLRDLCWPASRLGEAFEILARKAGLLQSNIQTPILSSLSQKADDDTIDKWLEFAGQQFFVEIEPVETSYSDIKQMLPMIGPALVRVKAEDSVVFLLILKTGKWKACVISPDLKLKRVSLRQIQEGLTMDLEMPLVKSINKMLFKAGVPHHRREKACKSVLKEYLRTKRINGFWLIRLPPGANFWKQVCHLNLHLYLIIVLGIHGLGIFLMLLSWWVIGKSSFQGHFEHAWVLAWILILFTIVPLQMIKTWLRNLLSIHAGALFKQRLLYGAMKLNPEEIRHQGAGQFLGRVMESEALDTTALDSGFTAITSITDICIAIGILAIGSGGWNHAFLLMGWLIITFLLSWRYYLRTNEWIVLYREMTNELVERMVGQRTRLAQEDKLHWHDEEDQILERYLNLSEKMDQISIQLKSVIPRGWIVIGLAGAAWIFITIQGNLAILAVSLGGILLAYKALTSFVAGVVSITEAKMAWEQASPLFKAGSRTESCQALSNEISDKNRFDSSQPVLLLKDVVFRYQDRARSILKECCIRINKGDRLLLEGPSGGGKSTLAALIAGLRFPESGLMLLQGIDWQTMGVQEWRKRVVAAPQFHENHVLTETFAFNLLMGRRWPPRSEDIEEAEAVCWELGLGDLLEKMPAGLQQMVGESGWQLSHGERSRLFIARALLQQADIIILDESFAALDPENLHRCMQCVLRRASTLLVIAHP